MPRRSRAFRLIFVLLTVVLLREVALLAASYDLLGHAGGMGVQLVAVALVLVAARGSERLPWRLIAAGMACWLAGDAWCYAVEENGPTLAGVSPSDIGYLLFPPLVFAGISLLLRLQVRAASSFVWADGVVAALAVAALSAAVFETTLGAPGESSATAMNLAYPLSDLVLVGFVTAAVAISAQPPDRTWRLIGGALVLFCVADALYLLKAAAGTYGTPDPIDALWDVAFLMLAAAAWQRRRSEREDRRPAATWPVAASLGFGAIGLALLVYAGVAELTPAAVILAALSLAGVLLRLRLTFRENRAILEAAQREAVTDALTGLGNRRALAADLQEALCDGGGSDAVALALFDLDGFKHYNDTYGHPAGDALLQRLARALEAAVASHGRAYRMGGDEFCALLRLGADPANDLLDAASAALSERGDGFSVTCSHGAIVLPLETADATEALRMADQRLYAAKQGSRASAGRQTRDVLLRALVARHPGLAVHSEDVARTAGATAVELGLDPATAERVRQAAELHDVGKVGIPDAILDKPGPLDAQEWAFVCRHTIIGERIIGGAPALREVASIVRSSHERWDGTGYPDGLTGDDIPLGARIVAVSDAYDALTRDRPFAPRRSHEDALQELRRCAGTQFDARVVEAFCRAVDRVTEPV